ncbi:hypothetical protein ACET3Z_012262 [Daucus carota]
MSSSYMHYLLFNHANLSPLSHQSPLPSATTQLMMRPREPSMWAKESDIYCHNTKFAESRILVEGIWGLDIY